MRFPTGVQIQGLRGGQQGWVQFRKRVSGGFSKDGCSQVLPHQHAMARRESDESGGRLIKEHAANM